MLPKVDDASLSLRDAYPEAEKDLSAARARLTKASLGCHNEVIGLPNALGYEVVQKQRFLPNVSGKHVSSQEPFRAMQHYMLKGNDDKLFPIIAFCISFSFELATASTRVPFCKRSLSTLRFCFLAESSMFTTCFRMHKA